MYDALLVLLLDDSLLLDSMLELLSWLLLVR
jgi:hypothetical protein